ncbi:MAG TPA: tripartite tricarboxylate transporter substrate binding protein [Usitatibacter sp.]|jgi:tripartite-type tricarboxylate transporter receptor subunit TctC|nr:tripartite tricarboxylate transporter substrate binding protein [Usitatibacter sp.]
MKSLLRVLCAVLAAVPMLAAAQGAYPVKPVRVIVSTVPGPLDAFARIICEKLSTSLKQPFIVENKAGAGGNIAAEYVKNQAPDGYTLLFAIDTTFTVNPGLYKKLPFDPDKDFAAISVPVTYAQMLTVNPTVPVKNVSELVALSKQKPLSYASGGNGSPSHLAGAYFLSVANTEMTHIPYKGTGQSVVDVIGGRVDTLFAVTSGVLPQVQGGKLKALAVSSPKRSPLAPDVPTIAEVGYPGFDVQFAYALMAPAGTPNEIVQLLNYEVQKAMHDPDVIEKNRIADYAPTNLDPKQSAVWLRENREKWTGVIRKANITAE